MREGCAAPHGPYGPCAWGSPPSRVSVWRKGREAHRPSLAHPPLAAAPPPPFLEGGGVDLPPVSLYKRCSPCNCYTTNPRDPIHRAARGDLSPCAIPSTSLPSLPCGSQVWSCIGPKVSYSTDTRCCAAGSLRKVSGGM